MGRGNSMRNGGFKFIPPLPAFRPPISEDGTSHKFSYTLLSSDGGTRLVLVKDGEVRALASEMFQPPEIRYRPYTFVIRDMQGVEIVRIVFESDGYLISSGSDFIRHADPEYLEETGLILTARTTSSKPV